MYINQAQLTIKKEPAIYSSYFIFGQIIPLLNPPQDLENYVCKENEFKILVPLYDTSNGNFKGIKQTLAHIMLRGDKYKTFFTYGYSEEFSKILYSFSKQVMPNVFVGTAFKNHFKEMIEMRHREKFSKFFFSSFNY